MEKITFETSVGNFEVELYTSHAPKTCTNFFQLASIGYYNDTIFHRIIKDFVSVDKYVYIFSLKKYFVLLFHFNCIILIIHNF